jgi:hypothetical protein
MGLPAELVRATFQQELERAKIIADKAGFILEGDPAALAIRVWYTARDGEPYILVGEFDDYKAQPPLLDFEEFDTGKRGTHRAYPWSRYDSFFHTDPIICAPFNRKAYRKVHTNWQLAGWMNSTEQGVQWSQYTTMPSMLLLVHKRLCHPQQYERRMTPP